MLVLSGGLDPATPPRHGAAVAERLGNARHVVSPYLGHGLSGQACAPRLITRFVREGDFVNLDADCLEKLPAASFFEPIEAAPAAKHVDDRGTPSCQVVQRPRAAPSHAGRRSGGRQFRRTRRHDYRAARSQRSRQDHHSADGRHAGRSRCRQHYGRRTRCPAAMRAASALSWACCPTRAACTHG